MTRSLPTAFTGTRRQWLRAFAPLSAVMLCGTLAWEPAPGQSAPAAGVSTGQQVTVPQAATAVTPASANGASAATAKVQPPVPPLSSNLADFAGQHVEAIRYEGVDFDKSDRLVAELQQKTGEPLVPDNVRAMTRRLFATGRYRNIAVRIERSAGGITLIFAGVPRFYIGRVEIHGLKEDRLASLLEYGTQLDPGTSYNGTKLATATANVKDALAQNGYYEPVIRVETQRDDAGDQVNVTYTVSTGPQARIGNVIITGTDPGITEAEFRKKGKLKRRTKVGRETVNNALSALRDYYQKKDHLEATISLQKSVYDPATQTLNYTFQAEQGPVVQVKVEGAKFSRSRLHLLVPVFEESTVDNDLLNEGTYNMKDYLQQEGYFDAQVSVKQVKPTPQTDTVLFLVDKGNKHKVVSVEIEGNKYFSTELLKEGLSIQKADAYQRSGRYSHELLVADENKIKSIYRANGFSDVAVTATAKDSEQVNPKTKTADISVQFKIVEGSQQKFGSVKIAGADQSRLKALLPLLQAQSGQPFSLLTLSGDRDTVLAYYLSNGFDQARVEVSQKVDPDDKTKTNISYDVSEGEQVFIGKVLESGRIHTKQKEIDSQVLVHSGDPLDQSALLETQRNLYGLALFNEVVAAVQNPSGDAEQKNVLLQLTEAKRWDVTYGFGFEAQTGVPSCGIYCTQQGTTKAQEGKAGVSPRVAVDISRINLFGTEDTLALHTTYGLLEKVATLTFTNPHLYGSRKFSAQLSGGYSNVQDITTFQASTLQGDFRVTHKATRKDTFIYDFQYRRVAVNPNSLAISADLIPLLSQPVRVGGPGITWFHDTRTPSPLDAGKGSYTSVSNFLASSAFGSQTDFNRSDITNSTYYTFGKKKYVFARLTRFGFIKSWGVNPNVPTTGNINNSPCAGTLVNTNPSCNPVPLPERLYAGGATSIRGFPINGAGPRDLQTGFPVGGSGVLINTLELRLPPPTLPYVGDSISFVVFHDMGNVFQHVGDIFPSIARFHQPDEQTCENVSGVIGTCNFNYFSHDIGIGARYRTPVGPIRVDFSYNLNPPRYPVIPTQTAPGVYVNGATPYVGQASHFNFFFSIGQSF